jgi:hypothetical protein
VEKSLIFVDTQLLDLVEGSLLPEISHDIELVGQDITYDG